MAQGGHSLQPARGDMHAAGPLQSSVGAPDPPQQQRLPPILEALAQGQPEQQPQKRKRQTMSRSVESEPPLPVDLVRHATPPPQRSCISVPSEIPAAPFHPRTPQELASGGGRIRRRQGAGNPSPSPWQGTLTGGLSQPSRDSSSRQVSPASRP